jgi:Ser/Thr protein kinase RdoA (MazF antagonist)
MMIFKAILVAYALPKTAQIIPFGTGLINSTWKVSTNDGAAYILQRINTDVFKQPRAIARNIQLVAEYLKIYHADYQFVAPVLTIDEEPMYEVPEGCFRLFPFVVGSHAKDVLSTPEQAYEAARQFGRFTRLLSAFDATQLNDTIPQFHDLTLRYQQFETALQQGNQTRVKECKTLIDKMLANANIVATYQQVINNPDFKRRVTHHDTKISNVLFDSEDKALCIIDLDTMMSGYFISDVGDMMRTYLSPVSEEEADFSKIELRLAFYQAIEQGYLSEMNAILTASEKAHFAFAGQFMLYMQALRFLTDYLNNDVYYGAKYATHNKVRAENQLVMLQKLLHK